jgi:GMP synthase (glutamine-hydrolysing)
MERILIVNNALNPNNQEFVNHFKNVLSKPKFRIVHYKDITKKLRDDFDKFILSGSPLEDKDAVHKELDYYRWIKNIKKPVLGICAGHQLIGKLYGSRLVHNKEHEIGYYKVYIKRGDAIFTDVKTTMTACELHTDSITLPKQFNLLAHSRECRVEIMKHKHKDIYGIEFHPEIFPTHKRLLKNFIELI